MAARALTAAGRRVAGQSQTRQILASSMSGASMNHSSASARREEERRDANGPAAVITRADVEAALNRKNVEVLQGEEEHDASSVPDQDRGIFVPADADADAHGEGAHPAPPHHLYGGVGRSVLVLDQAVFVREEEMEDVERPAMDLTDANGGNNN
ncbi:hypothetical protein VPH35_069849 [Triticum aestivum]